MGAQTSTACNCQSNEEEAAHGVNVSAVSSEHSSKAPEPAAAEADAPDVPEPAPAKHITGRKADPETLADGVRSDDSEQFVLSKETTASTKEWETLAVSDAVMSATRVDGESMVSMGTSMRKSGRRMAKSLKVTETVGHVTSAALQCAINNPGKLEDIYKLEKALGKGSFGAVTLASVKATGARRAIKTISKQRLKQNTAELRNELEILKMLDHPATILLYEIFETDDELHLVMELCSGGCLTDRVKLVGSGLKESEAAETTRQLAWSLIYIHNLGIVHRDIKPDNILLKTPAAEPIGKNSFKLADFGLACRYTPGVALRQTAGTLKFMAPEVLLKNYDNKCDNWSVGVVLHYLLSAKLPFQDEAQVKEGKAKMSSQEWCDVSQNAVTLMVGLLNKDVKARYSNKMVLDDKFIRKNAPSGKTIINKYGFLEDLQRFRSLNKFKRAALRVVVSLLDDTEIVRGRQLFMALDVDGSGTVTAKDLTQEKKRKTGKALRQQTKIEQSKIDCAFGVSVASVDGTEVVTDEIEYGYSEFLAATIDSTKCLGKKILKAAFQVFDRNNDGNIDLAELVNGHMLGAVSREELQHILEGQDADGNSGIDFSEFSQMMLQELSLRKRVSARMKIAQDDQNSSNGSDG